MNDAAEHQLARTSRRLSSEWSIPLRSVAGDETTGSRRASGENVASHHGSQPGEVRQRVGGGVRPAHREGAHGSATAGTHSGQEQSGSRARPVERRDGRARDSVFRPVKPWRNTRLCPCSPEDRKAGTRESTGLEAHSIRGSCPATERCHGEVLVRPASERLRRMGNG